MRPGTRGVRVVAGAFAVMAAVLAVAHPAPAQTPALKVVMRDKLTHAQLPLGDLATSRWASLGEHATALKQLTTRPAWRVLQSEEYARSTVRFVAALEDVIRAASRRDLDEAAAAYNSLTLACVQCHREVARMRMAGPAPQ